MYLPSGRAACASQDEIDLIQATFVGHLLCVRTWLDAQGITGVDRPGPGAQGSLSLGGTRNCTSCDWGLRARQKEHDEGTRPWGAGILLPLL